MDTECPSCGIEFEAEEWTCGTCPKCGRKYQWDEMCTTDFSDCWTYVDWLEKPKSTTTTATTTTSRKIRKGDNPERLCNGELMGISLGYFTLLVVLVFYAVLAVMNTSRTQIDPVATISGVLVGAAMLIWYFWKPTQEPRDPREPQKPTNLR